MSAEVEPGDVSDALLGQSVWTDEDITRHGIPIYDMPFISIGGGVGSFVMVDTLRVAGVDPSQIRVLTDLDFPTRTYEYLATNSQIPRHERLRSDSSSVLDNIWGWPGYALREAWANKKVGPAFQVATEPILADYYTPQAGQVYTSVAREAHRIGWNQMLDIGVARTVRKRAAGGYFVIHTPSDNRYNSKRIAYRCWYVHIAVGYPGVRFLPDLQEYREETDDFASVVNAYEPHDHVYNEALERPTTVLVRGSGIVASRVLQRAIDDREQRGSQTQIWHLFRTYVDQPQGDTPTFRRPARNGWVYQGFNFPKAAWGGQLKDHLESLEGDERARFLDSLGGTNTAPRRSWREQLDRGTAQGFYKQAQGEVQRVERLESERMVRTHVRDRNGTNYVIDANFIVDATGLEADISEHRVLNDLLVHAGAAKNPKGRLDVERHFEIRGTASGEGRLYASGSITLGGYYAGVDSFLGLQYAALQIADALAARGFGARIGPGRSMSQWWRWARNRQP